MTDYAAIILDAVNKGFTFYYEDTSVRGWNTPMQVFVAEAVMESIGPCLPPKTQCDQSLHDLLAKCRSRLDWERGQYRAVEIIAEIDAVLKGGA